MTPEQQDANDLRDVLIRNGFRRCDIAACNCNSWHHVGGFAARFREIEEAVGDHNGKTLLQSVQEKLAQLARLREILEPLRAALGFLDLCRKDPETAKITGAMRDAHEGLEDAARIAIAEMLRVTAPEVPK